MITVEQILSLENDKILKLEGITYVYVNCVCIHADSIEKDNKSLFFYKKDIVVASVTLLPNSKIEIKNLSSLSMKYENQYELYIQTIKIKH